jgi:serine phosphatase RsbU (regulator of sigma subunit)
MSQPDYPRWNLPLPEGRTPWLCNVVWGGNRLVLESFTVPGLDGYLLSVPCADSTAGGDIYHVTVCNHGVFSKFLLIDVAGHGSAASRISSRLQQPLVTLMNELDNSAILEQLNRNILASEASGSFATAAAATYNHWDRSWSYAYAGHPYMLVRRHGRWQALPECCAGVPIGVVGDSRYFQNEIILQGDDWLFLFSDAVLEIKRADGSRLGFGGLLKLLAGIEADDVGDFYQALADALVKTNAGECFDDDLTLILVKQQPARERLPGRLAASARRLLMRWRKRHTVRCRSAPSDLSASASV